MIDESMAVSDEDNGTARLGLDPDFSLLTDIADRMGFRRDHPLPLTLPDQIPDEVQALSFAGEEAPLPAARTLQRSRLRHQGGHQGSRIRGKMGILSAIEKGFRVGFPSHAKGGFQVENVDTGRGKALQERLQGSGIPGQKACHQAGWVD